MEHNVSILIYGVQWWSWGDETFIIYLNLGSAGKNTKGGIGYFRFWKSN